jgi:hypothetical protein
MKFKVKNAFECSGCASVPVGGVALRVLPLEVLLGLGREQLTRQSAGGERVGGGVGGLRGRVRSRRPRPQKGRRRDQKVTLHDYDSIVFIQIFVNTFCKTLMMCIEYALNYQKHILVVLHLFDRCLILARREAFQQSKKDLELLEKESLDIKEKVKKRTLE